MSYEIVRNCSVLQDKETGKYYAKLKTASNNVYPHYYEEWTLGKDSKYNFTKEELASVGLAITQPSNNKNITILVNLDDRDIGENLKYRLITKYNAVQSNVSEILNKNITNFNFFDMNNNKKYDIIIGNPPYIEFQKAEHKPKENMGNIYANFLSYSANLLKSNGIMAFIIPISYISCFDILRCLARIMDIVATSTLCLNVYSSLVFKELI